MYHSTDPFNFLAQRTGYSAPTVETFLEARYRYQHLNRVAVPGQCSDAERAEHADLLSPEDEMPFEDNNNLLAYITRVTDLEHSVVANLIAEETGYMASVGLIDPRAYDGARAWANSVLNQLGK